VWNGRKDLRGRGTGAPADTCESGSEVAASTLLLVTVASSASVLSVSGRSWWPVCALPGAAWCASSWCFCWLLVRRWDNLGWDVEAAGADRIEGGGRHEVGQ